MSRADWIGLSMAVACLQSQRGLHSLLSTCLSAGWVVVDLGEKEWRKVKPGFGIAKMVVQHLYRCQQE